MYVCNYNLDLRRARGSRLAGGWVRGKKDRALINTLMLTMWCQYVWAECKQDLRKVRKTVKTAGGCVRGKKEP